MARSTLKGIIRNIVEREVRHFVEKDGRVADIDEKKIELIAPSKNFSDWRFEMPLRIFGTPRSYEVGGWIDELGFVNMSYIIYGSGYMVSGDDLLTFKFDK